MLNPFKYGYCDFIVKTNLSITFDPQSSDLTFSDKYFLISNTLSLILH